MSRSAGINGTLAIIHKKLQKNEPIPDIYRLRKLLLPDPTLFSHKVVLEVLIPSNLTNSYHFHCFILIPTETHDKILEMGYKLPLKVINEDNNGTFFFLLSFVFMIRASFLIK